MTIRLVTYNIHKGIGGVDRRYRLSRIVDTLAHYQADVVFLQEVDDGVPRSRLHRQVEELADALQFSHHAFQRNVKLKRGHYGNAILSRFPLRPIWDVDLTLPLKKRRQALIAKAIATINGRHRVVVLTNLHLGLAGYERTRQLKRLLDCDPLRNVRHDTPCFVAGDFNDVWGTLGKRLMTPAGFHSASGKIRTFPAFRPVRSLDSIYYRGGLTLSNAFAGQIKTAKAASDHLPLVADFSLNA